jgi:hypothetical protein
MEIKNSFSQDDLFLAINELQKVWIYERYVYNYDHQLSHQETETLDSKNISYGINLGNLRKIFQKKD